LTYGEEYHILVNNDASDIFELAVQASNDQCKSTFGPLSIGDVIHGSNAQASLDDVDECHLLSN
jgi:hypothetical protein